MKSLLFIGGGIESVPGILKAKKMGLCVIASDGNSLAPGLKIADYKLIVSTYDIRATVGAALEYHASHPINGVICLGTDVPQTVSAVAKALGIPGISEEAAFLACDKLAMKDRLSERGIPIPWYTQIKDLSHLIDFCQYSDETFVLKPVDSRGARGVLRIDKNTDFNWAYNSSIRFSPSERVMLERFISGPQLSTESIVIDGQCHTIGYSDRNYEFLDRFAPHIIENGGDLPPSLPDVTLNACHHLLERSAAAFGIRNGTIKGDLVVHDGEPFIIEIAARLSGGYFCTHEIPLNTGIDFVEIAIKQCLGEKIGDEELRPKFNKSVSQRYFFAEPGMVCEIIIPEWVYSDPEIVFFEMRANIGDMISRTDSHPARAGLVIVSSSDRLSSIRKAERVVRSIKILTK